MPEIYEKIDDSFPLFLLIAFSLAIFSIVIGSLLSAVWLIFAGSWVRVAKFGYSKAFHATLMCNFITTMFHFTILIFIVYILKLEREADRSATITQRLGFYFSPIYLIYYTIGSVLVHSLVFSHVFVDKNGQPLRFSKAVLLALAYLAMYTMFTTMVTLIGFAINGTLR
ncbi:MAG: hypothetical protein R3B84_03115 [Zavarzinella sp.]